MTPGSVTFLIYLLVAALALVSSAANAGDIAFSDGFEPPPPIAVDDTYQLEEDAALDISPLLGVLANDTLDEGVPAQLVLGPTEGSLELLDDGSFRYWPDADFNGNDEFSYEIADTGGSSIGIVTIEVLAINDPPVISGVFDFRVANSSNPLVISNFVSVSAGPANEASQTVSIQILTGDGRGTCANCPTLDAEGNLELTPGVSQLGNLRVVAGDDGGSAGNSQDTSEVAFHIELAAAENFPPGGTTAVDFAEASHIINRLTFGSTIASLNQLLDQGANTWIAQQLIPQAMNDSDLEAMLARNFLPEESFEQLNRDRITRAQLSERQLLEVMAAFWDRHFETGQQTSVGATLEYRQQNTIRQLAMGGFDLLLLAMLQDPALLLASENSVNTMSAPNTTLARQLLEFHTLGSDGGYNETDVAEAARCLTGWTVADGSYLYNNSTHDSGEKNLLGLNIPAGGDQSDVIALVDHLISLPGAADFVARSLSIEFVDRDPPGDVVAAVAGAFSASGGNITTALTTLFSHSRFRSDSGYRGNLLRGDAGHLVAMARKLGNTPLGLMLPDIAGAARLDMVNHPTQVKSPLSSPQGIKTQWDNGVALGSLRGSATSLDAGVDVLIARLGATTSDSILDGLEYLFCRGVFAGGARAILENLLTDGDPGSFALTSEIIDQEVRNTLILSMSLSDARIR